MRCIIEPLQPPAPSGPCGTLIISDIDGNVYETVSIGSQRWMKQNLKVSKYNNGDEIPDSTNSTWGTATIGARTGYNVNVVPLSDYVGTFGYLYNWYAVNDSRKLCPSGWHVPTDAEWTILIQAYDPGALINSATQSTTAGTVLKSAVTNSPSGSGLGWDPGTAGTNISGFTALPGGLRLNGSGNSFLIRTEANFWSATGFGNGLARNWSLINTNGSVFRSDNDKKQGFSVRCLKD